MINNQKEAVYEKVESEEIVIYTGVVKVDGSSHSPDPVRAILITLVPACGL